MCLGTDFLIYFSEFIYHFWRTCFIKNKYNLDCKGTYLLNFHELEMVLESINGFERSNDLEAIILFLIDQSIFFSSEGSRINEEYWRDRK